jgi:hypothetical protein
MEPAEETRTVEYPHHAQPPYRDEPSLDEAERARRAACRVLLLGRSVTVGNGLMPALRSVAETIRAGMDVLSPAEQDAVRRSARTYADARKHTRRLRPGPVKHVRRKRNAPGDSFISGAASPGGSSSQLALEADVTT